MARISQFLTRAVRSHLSHILLAVSWSFILFVVMRCPLNHPQFVDCTPVGDEIYTITSVLHVYPIWIVIVGIAHLPSVLVTTGVTKLFQMAFSLSCAPTAEVELPLFFASSTVQWLLVGYMIESLRRWVHSHS